MTSAADCPRTWEVEAARDGRLAGAARERFLKHLAQCAACERAQAQLAQLSQMLGAPTTPDELALRRVRQRVLSAFDSHNLRDRPSQVRWRAPALIALAAVAALALGVRHAPAALTATRTRLALLRKPAAPEPVALRLSADGGARFEHERRGELEQVKLHAGNLHIAFDRGLHARLLVQTPDGEIEDLGTVFHVSVENGQTTRIAVDEGQIRFRRPGHPDVLLSAGQNYQPEPEPEPAPITRAAPRPHPQPRAAARDTTAEDRAYLEVLDLLHAGHAEEARAAARRYVRNYPRGLRLRELEHLARSARP